MVFAVSQRFLSRKLGKKSWFLMQEVLLGSSEALRGAWLEAHLPLLVRQGGNMQFKLLKGFT